MYDAEVTIVCWFSSLSSYVGNAIGHLCVESFFRVLIGGIVVFAIVIDLTVCGNWLRVANAIVIIRFCVISSDAKILPPKKFIDQN